MRNIVQIVFVSIDEEEEEKWDENVNSSTVVTLKSKSYVVKEL